MVFFMEHRKESNQETRNKVEPPIQKTVVWSCLGMLLAVGMGIGLSASGQVLPVEYRLVFGLVFAVFCGVLGTILVGLGLRYERRVMPQVIIPGGLVEALALAIESANLPAHLEIAQVGRLDATLAELKELAEQLRKQPRVGIDPAIQDRLEELALEWLGEEGWQEWCRVIELHYRPQKFL
jgi:hypothetical protein